MRQPSDVPVKFFAYPPSIRSKPDLLTQECKRRYGEWRDDHNLSSCFNASLSYPCGCRTTGEPMCVKEKTQHVYRRRRSTRKPKRVDIPPENTEETWHWKAGSVGGDCHNITVRQDCFDGCCESVPGCSLPMALCGSLLDPTTTMKYFLDLFCV